MVGARAAYRTSFAVLLRDVSEEPRYRRQWRDYRTPAGGRPVKKFLMKLTSAERAVIVVAMKEVTRDGLIAAKHLAGDIYEVKADTNDKFFRILFAAEGGHNQVLLSLEAFAKKTGKTPKAKLDLAKDRLKDWREQGELLRKDRATTEKSKRGG
jgi:phage-related protein